MEHITTTTRIVSAALSPASITDSWDALEKGTPVKVSLPGKRSFVGTYQGRVADNAGATVCVNVYGGTGGRGVMRSVRPEHVKPVKPKRQRP